MRLELRACKTSQSLMTRERHKATQLSRMRGESVFLTENAVMWQGLWIQRQWCIGLCRSSASVFDLVLDIAVFTQENLLEQNTLEYMKILQGRGGGRCCIPNIYIPNIRWLCFLMVAVGFPKELCFASPSGVAGRYHLASSY